MLELLWLVSSVEVGVANDDDDDVVVVVLPLFFTSHY